jgi:hypothetical protein
LRAVEDGGDYGRIQEPELQEHGEIARLAAFDCGQFLQAYAIALHQGLARKPGFRDKFD